MRQNDIKTLSVSTINLTNDIRMNTYCSNSRVYFHLRNEHLVYNVKYINHNAKTFMVSKKVLHHSLLFLCTSNFKYLWNLKKLSDQAQIVRECLMYP